MRKTYIVLLILVMAGLVSSSASEVLTETSPLIIDGNGSSVDIEAALQEQKFSNNPTIQVINAPGTVIKNQIFDGVNLTLIDSPNSYIVRNTFRNYKISFDSYSILQLVNSNGTQVVENTFERVTILGSISSFKVIEVTNSDNVEVVGNSITSVLGEGLQKSVLAYSIFFTGSSGISVRDNTISDVSMTGIASIDYYVISVNEGGNSTISGNSISQLTVDTTGRSTGIGIIVVNFNQYDDIVIGIWNNSISDNNISSLDATASFSGINVQTTSPLIGLGSSTQVLSNQVSNSQVTSTIKGPDGYRAAVNTGIVLNSQVKSAELKSNLISYLTSASPATLSGSYVEGVSVVNGIYTVMESNQFKGLVADNQFPILIASSTNILLQFEYGLTIPVQWINYDASITEFGVFANGEKILSGVYDSSVGIALDFSVLSLGKNGIEVRYTHIDNSVSKESFTVDIVDTISPHITGKSYIEMELGTAELLSWSISDRNLDRISLSMDSIVLMTNISVTDLFNMTYLFRPEKAGIYEFVVNATDLSSNFKTYSTIVNVTSIPDFSITHLDDVTLYSLSNYNLSWNVGKISEFMVYVNDTAVKATYVDGNVSIVFIPEDYVKYNITLLVTDSYGRSLTDVVIINVIPPLPSVFNYGSRTVQEGTAGSVKWTIIDITSGNYSVYLDGISLLNGSYSISKDVEISLDSLGVGTYNYTIVLHNSFGYEVSNSVPVTIYVPVVKGNSLGTQDQSEVDNPFPIDLDVLLSPPALIAAGAIGVGSIGVILLRRRG